MLLMLLMLRTRITPGEMRSMGGGGDGFEAVEPPVEPFSRCESRKAPSGRRHLVRFVWLYAVPFGG
jgi:hypothetical protein